VEGVKEDIIVIQDIVLLIAYPAVLEKNVEVMDVEQIIIVELVQILMVQLRVLQEHALLLVLQAGETATETE
jgi:hypothetical protein